MKLRIEKHSFPFKKPFSITGYNFTECNTVRVYVEENGFVGRGEAVGIYYKGETIDSIEEQLISISDRFSSIQSREQIQDLLPSGGARNALDCALWDLEAKRSKRSVWELLDISPKPLVSVATVGLDTPEMMAETARKLYNYPILKIKLSSDDPLARLTAIRKIRPKALLVVDVNQGWTFEELVKYIPKINKIGVEMVEQPLPRGKDYELQDYKSAVPLAADESCLDSSEYELVAKRYDIINIKLDKCGGLTEGLKIVESAKRDGKGLMIGNMCGSSLSMAPAYVIGQSCQYVDIDGPLFAKEDISNGLRYDKGGLVSIPNANLWG
jgi:L-alanine-DL-glutamate epimerase-like enolase superfamily enzyme